MGFEGTDKLTHTRGLELQNSCGDTINITGHWNSWPQNSTNGSTIRAPIRATHNFCIGINAKLLDECIVSG